MVAYKWIFDYNVVAHLDPDYTKYLNDTRNETRKIVDARCEQLGISIRLPDTRVQYRMELAERHRQNETRIRRAYNHDFTEFEQDILDLMTDKKAPVSQDANPFAENPEARETDGYNPDFYDPAHIAEDLRKEFDDDALQKHTKNHLLYVPYYYELKDEYKNPPKVDMDKYIGPELQLMPPKTVLDVGSKIVYDTGIYHGIGETTYADASVKINRCKFTKDKNDGKIRLIYCSYWFDRINNATHELKDDFTMATYNPETKQMYLRRFESKKTKGDRLKWRPVINNCGINMSHLAGLIGRVEGCHPEIANNFLRAVFEAVQKDVPDVWIDYDMVLLPQWITSPVKIDWDQKSNAHDYAMYQLGHTVLEHKVGRALPWIDPHTYNTIIRLYEDRGLDSEQAEDEEILYSPTDLMKVRKRRIGKIIPNLKKHTNFTSLMQSLLGVVYSKKTMKFIKVFYDNVSVNEIVNLHRTMTDDSVPKICKHFISSNINKLADCWVPEHERAIVKAAIDYVMEAGRPRGRRVEGRVKHWVASYVKLCSRFINIDDGHFQGVPSWFTWEDMMSMAEQTHVRVRPNRFKRARHVRELHDMLADRQRRDAVAIRNYRDKPFLEFDHVETDYNGFVFEFLGTAEELVHEGTVMHHCVGSYADRCLAGKSIIFSMRKDDKSYVTIELSGRDYDIRQQYTIADNVITNEKILDIIENWHEDMLHMHKDDEAPYEVLAMQRIHEMMKDDDPESYRMLKQIRDRFDFERVVRRARPIPQNADYALEV